MTDEEIRQHLLEVAASSVEFRMLDRYVVVQIDTRTWDEIQAWADKEREP